MKVNFNSLTELYKRIEPALISKEEELKHLGFKNIKATDIWDYLKAKIWIHSEGLNLFEMIDTIFNLTGIELLKYVEEKNK